MTPTKILVGVVQIFGVPPIPIATLLHLLTFRLTIFDLYFFFLIDKELITHPERPNTRHFLSTFVNKWLLLRKEINQFLILFL